MNLHHLLRGAAAMWLIACASVSHSDVQNLPKPERLTHEQAQGDARELIRLLDESHPDPYTAFGGRVAFKMAAGELLQQLPKEGMSRSELAERLAEFLARLKDAHTSLHPISMQQESTVLPFRFSVGPRGLFLSAWNVPQLDGLLGARLLAIDDRSAEQLLARASRLRGAENEFHARVILRDRLRSLEGLRKLLGSPQAASVVLRLQTPRGKTRSIMVPLPKGDDRPPAGGWRAKRPIWNAVAESDGPFRQQFFDSRHAAYLALDAILPREAYEFQRGSGWGDLRAALASRYRAMGKAAPEDIDAAIAGIPSLVEIGATLLEEMKRRQSKYLIVDLEGNGGGVTPSAEPLLYQIYGDDYFARDSRAIYTTLISPLYLKKFGTSIEALRLERHRPELQVGDFVTHRR